MDGMAAEWPVRTGEIRRCRAGRASAGAVQFQNPLDGRQPPLEVEVLLHEQAQRREQVLVTPPVSWRHLARVDALDHLEALEDLLREVHGLSPGGVSRRG